jgi:hypothetical protein
MNWAQVSLCQRGILTHEKPFVNPKQRVSAARDRVVKSDRPTFVIRLQPQPGVDPIRGLRWILKTALRRFGLRCVEGREEADRS